jgi:hypothetical protein
MTTNIDTTLPQTNVLSKISATINPFAPLAFDETNGIQAALRIVLFAGATYLLWSKSKKAAYATAGAAAISLFTSLSAKHGL